MLALTKEATQMLISLITEELGHLVDVADKAYVDAADSVVLQHVDDADTALRQYIDSQSQILGQRIDGNDTSIRQYVDSKDSAVRQYVDTKEATLNSTINTGDASVKQYANTQDAALESKIMNAVNAAIEKALNEKIVASKTDLVSGSSALKTGTLYCVVE